MNTGHQICGIPHEYVHKFITKNISLSHVVQIFPPPCANIYCTSSRMSSMIISSVEAHGLFAMDGVFNPDSTIIVCVSHNQIFHYIDPC